ARLPGGGRCHRAGRRRGDRRGAPDRGPGGRRDVDRVPRDGTPGLPVPRKLETRFRSVQYPVKGVPVQERAAHRAAAEDGQGTRAFEADSDNRFLKPGKRPPTPERGGGLCPPDRFQADRRPVADLPTTRGTSRTASLL